MLNKFLASPLVRIASRYGALGAVLTMLFVISMYYMDVHPFLVNPFLDPRIPVLAIMLSFGLKEYRDVIQGGTLYFGQSMVMCFMITVVLALLCWAGIVGFATLVPDFVHNFVELAEEQTKNFSAEDINRIGKETFEQSLKELKQADRYFMAQRYFFQTYIISFFLSIIISVVLRRTPKEPGGYRNSP